MGGIAVHLETSLINVEGMSCGHCVKSIEQAVGSLNGVSKVSASLTEKKVSVEYDSDRVTLETIKNIINDQGYTVK
jgi:copper chaperone